MTYQPIASRVTGGERRVDVSDLTLTDLMAEVLTQMKIMNAHLAIMTGEELDETDIKVHFK